MRPSAIQPPSNSNRADWNTLRTLIPYLMEFKWRVVVAMSLLIFSKLANVSVPLVLKEIIDAMDKTKSVLVIPVFLIVGYGVLRLFSTLFGELRDAVFANVTQRAIRRVALQVFEHLHSLSLRFHLDRQTGGVSRDIERGTRGIGFLLNFTLFNILPTLLEIGLVAGILLKKYSPWFAIITFITLVIYIAFTLFITEWRMVVRRTMNDLDSKANTRAIDSLLNYETVKYFGNEQYEADRYDHHMEHWEAAAVRNQTSLALLNSVQSVVIAIGITALMLLAADQVVKGKMTVGDLVLVNVYMIQLYMPLHFLGFVYREIRHALADMEKMFSLLHEEREVADAPDATALQVGQCGSKVRGRQFFLCAGAPDFVRRELYHPGRAQGRRGRRERGGQVHAVAAAVPLLRCAAGAHPDQRPGYPQRDPNQPARRDRHRAAGYGAVQRHDLLQHRLWPPRCLARGHHGRGAGGAYPPLHRDAAARLRHHGWRARPETVRRRKAARCDRARDSEESGGPDLR